MNTITKSQYRADPLVCLTPTEAICKRTTEKIITFIREYFEKYGFKKAIVGLSGGIDSSLITALCTQALGADKVYGVIIPSQFTTHQHIQYALTIAEKLKIKYNNYKNVQNHFEETVHLLDKMGEKSSEKDTQKLKTGNIHARVRMIILRDIAKAHNGLVIGTTNKTEMRLGYATMAGDGLGGIDIEPIAGLYKTTEKYLARYLGLPEKIINQTPTAGLWEGQTDEGEIGILYEFIDQILLGLEIECPEDEILQAIKSDEVTMDKIQLVKNMVTNNQFKNNVPPSPEI